MKLLLNERVVEVVDDGSTENAGRDQLQVITTDTLSVLSERSVFLGSKLATVVFPALAKYIVDVH